MSNEESSIFNSLEKENVRSSRVPRALIIVASTVIILAGIQAASGLVGPMLLALFLAIILLVPLRWLQKHGVPHFLAFLVVLICTITLFVGITYFVSPSLTKFIGQIPGYKDKVVEKYDDFKVQLEQWGFGIVEWGDRILPRQKQTDEESDLPNEPVEPAPPPQVALPVHVPPQESTDVAVNDDIEDSVAETGDEPKTAEDIAALSEKEVKEWAEQTIETKELPSLIAIEPTVLAAWLARAMLYVRGMLEGGFLVLLFTIFMLLEASFFPAKVNRAFGKDGPINIGHFHRIAEDLRRYLFLKTLCNLMSGGAAMSVYYMFGIETWFLWGVLAFVMYYIPNIGGTLAAVIPGILILASLGVPYVLLYALCLLILECTIAYGIEPRLLGHGLRLSTLVIILSLFFWGFLLGAIGLFLAAPLTVMMKIILQAFPETRWIAIFLEGSRETH
ncbi:MAG: AI-2E family transporter [Planctomycetaceae bacterium]|jgi:predicted PurR-regulated permease PerM|nr:AI-2E family transporter [Planctomycetaceae bacterium]